MIDKYLLGLRFTKIATNNLYYLFDKSHSLVLVLYVDDLILIGSSDRLMCVVEILKRFHMMECKLLANLTIPNQMLLADLDFVFVDPSIYKELIGSLMYLVNNRHDICFVVNTLS